MAIDYLKSNNKRGLESCINRVQYWAKDQSIQAAPSTLESFLKKINAQFEKASIIYVSLEIDNHSSLAIDALENIRAKLSITNSFINQNFNYC